MEPGQIDHVLAQVTGFLVRIGTPIGLVYLAWGAFSGLLSGGTDRALREVLKRGLILGVLLAILTQAPTVFALFGAVGTALVSGVVDALQQALHGSAV